MRIKEERIENRMKMKLLRGRNNYVKYNQEPGGKIQENNTDEGLEKTKQLCEV
jgi:hypothetical protein